MNKVIMIALVMLAASCGRHERFDAAKQTNTVSRSVVVSAPVATGPIRQACLASGRKERSNALCGCIQAAANQTLTPSQQSRAVSFYQTPHYAQEIRQSDRSRDERFWEAYRVYGERAERLCR
ncbi:MAG: hypothetical protein AAGF56_02655 [Pseudomonadota bacterium]